MPSEHPIVSAEACYDPNTGEVLFWIPIHAVPVGSSPHKGHVHYKAGKRTKEKPEIQKHP